MMSLLTPVITLLPPGKLVAASRVHMTPCISQNDLTAAMDEAIMLPGRYVEMSLYTSVN